MSEGILQEEIEYLEFTLGTIATEIQRQLKTLEGRRRDLIDTGKDMWENAVHFSTDFEKMTEVVQYLLTLNSQTVSYDIVKNQLERLQRMLNSPYFGRFDFIEEGFDRSEKIYIGISSLVDSGTKDILIYDWRAPIASIYYEYELGRSRYRAPQGLIEGEVILKRQYKIHKGQLSYYFDCNLKIDDEMLQQALCQNTSGSMRNIVESIQKEQNAIIRDTENELLVVQGVAGSGKTSVALHRIAFLLYQGLDNKLNSSNVVIISPNELFSKYISRVLPELGEDNVRQLTFGEILELHLRDRFSLHDRNHMLEDLVLEKDERRRQVRQAALEFKGSKEFINILEELIEYYMLNLVEFHDLYYDGRTIETRHRLRSMLLNEKSNMPIAKRMERMQRIIFEKIKPMRKSRLSKLETFVQKLDGHEFDIKPFSRLLSIKETKRLLNTIQSFTSIDYFQVYQALFKEKNLLMRLAKGSDLPDCIDEIIEDTKRRLDEGCVEYEDCVPLLFIKLKLEEEILLPDIRHVVVDEAQDYSPLHYMLLKLMFRHSCFTVLGDINQSIDQKGDLIIYQEIHRILDKKKSMQLMMNKTYRATYEINSFTQRILNLQQEIISFDRIGRPPEVFCFASREEMNLQLIHQLGALKMEGFESLAVICRSFQEAQELFAEIGKAIDISLVSLAEEVIEAGAAIIPAYMSKGLEFDAVIVYNASEETYRTELDRRLLYIACTRALHSLTLLCTGRASTFVLK